MPTVSEGKSRKEGRALSDFNTLIASPRLGSREKKKPKGQREQLNKTKKMNRTTNEFQDSSESEPELFISGDELMNQNQSSKKSWKNKRSMRMASELEEIKCRKANEREDRSLGSQGFVYVMANKQPLWNEATQVYQLDFGGRVTQESAKNFQIELDGRQVMISNISEFKNELSLHLTGVSIFLFLLQPLKQKHQTCVTSSCISLGFSFKKKSSFTMLMFWLLLSF